jgi:ketosteroid isomerase-like protein
MSSNAERASVLVRALRAAIDRDIDTLRAVLADDVTTWTPGQSATSLAELIDELESRGDAFSDLVFDATPLDVGGDFACVEWTVGMTHSGLLALADGTRIEPSGIRVDVHGVTVAEFEGERICSLRQYWDEFAVLDQLAT